jgi:hypothetical protein
MISVREKGSFIIPFGIGILLQGLWKNQVSLAEKFLVMRLMYL